MDTTIVVGSDGSAPSRSALMWAAQRAETLGMRLLLCHVIDDEWAGLGQGPLVPEAAILGALEAEAAIARSVFPNVDIRCSVLAGRPVAVLADLSLDADLLVVGTHKTGFIQGRAFESRFAGLAALVENAVAFIPDAVTSQRRGVVAGIGRSQSNTVVVRHAGAEATRFGDPLTLLGSWEDDSSGPPLVAPGRDRLISASVDASLERAAELASIDYPGLAVRTKNVRRGAADALIDASLSARLLVIGHSVDRLRKSVIHDVLLNLSRPTIVVREFVPLDISAPSSAHPMPAFTEN